MKKVAIVTLLALACAQPPSSAEQPPNVQEAIEFLKNACLSGESVKIEAEGEGAGSLVRLIKPEISARANLEFKKESLQGIAKGLRDQLAAEDREKTRKCMEPYIETLLATILGEGGRPKNIREACVEWEERCDGQRLYKYIQHIDGRDPGNHMNPTPRTWTLSCKSYCAKHPICAVLRESGETTSLACDDVTNCLDAPDDGTCTARLAKREEYSGCKGAKVCTLKRFTIVD